MNKLNIIKKIFLFTISILIFSCSSDSSEADNPIFENSILADYFAEIGFIKDFSVDKNGEVYYLYGGDSSGDAATSLRKIDKIGDITILDELDKSLFGNHMGITNSEDGKVYYVTDSHDGGNKVYMHSISSSATSTYSMTPISSPFVGPIRMSSIESFSDNTYITFDYSSFGLRRYIPGLDTDIIIAGSGKELITDGTGLNASFKFVTEIVVVGDIIYVIDDGNNLRKIEKIENDFNVTTLVGDYVSKFNDIAFDQNGDILVLIAQKGIYKLNKSNNTLEEYLIGEVSFKSGFAGVSTKWGSFDKILIDKNDLFLYSHDQICKISDFKTKI